MRRRRALIVVGSGLCLLSVAGCAASTRASSTESLASISESLNESASAAATAELVARLYADGQIPAVTADAALEDAVSAADAAAHSLTTIVVPDAETLAMQERALIAAQGAARAVVAARVWVGSTSAPPSGVIRDALTMSGADLERATEQVEDLLQDGGT